MLYGRIYDCGINLATADVLLNERCVFSNDLGEICFRPQNASVGVLTYADMFGFQKDGKEAYFYIRELPSNSLPHVNFSKADKRNYWSEHHDTHHHRALEGHHGL